MNTQKPYSPPLPPRNPKSQKVKPIKSIYAEAESPKGKDGIYAEAGGRKLSYEQLKNGHTSLEELFRTKLYEGRNTFQMAHKQPAAKREAFLNDCVSSFGDQVPLEDAKKLYAEYLFSKDFKKDFPKEASPLERIAKSTNPLSEIKAIEEETSIPIDTIRLQYNIAQEDKVLKLFTEQEIADIESLLNDPNIQSELKKFKPEILEQSKRNWESRGYNEEQISELATREALRTYGNELKGIPIDSLLDYQNIKIEGKQPRTLDEAAPEVPPRKESLTKEIVYTEVVHNGAPGPAPVNRDPTEYVTIDSVKTQALGKKAKTWAEFKETRAFSSCTRLLNTRVNKEAISKNGLDEKLAEKIIENYKLYKESRNEVPTEGVTKENLMAVYKSQAKEQEASKEKTLAATVGQIKEKMTGYVPKGQTGATQQASAVTPRGNSALPAKKPQGRDGGMQHG